MHRTSGRLQTGQSHGSPRSRLQWSLEFTQKFQLPYLHRHEICYEKNYNTNNLCTYDCCTFVHTMQGARSVPAFLAHPAWAAFHRVWHEEGKNTFFDIIISTLVFSHEHFQQVLTLVKWVCHVSSTLQPGTPGITMWKAEAVLTGTSNLSRTENTFSQQYCLALCWSELLGLEVISRVTNSKRWYKNSRN